MSMLSGDNILDVILDNADVKTLNAFYDVRALNMLPDTIIYRPFLMVVNTQMKNLPGEHWLAVHIDEYRRGEVFDSLAMPVNLHLSRWMNKFTVTWKRNKKMYQHPLSTKCGAFVIYFILNRLNAVNMQDTFKHFSYNLHDNDVIVSQYYSSLK